MLVQAGGGRGPRVSCFVLASDTESMSSRVKLDKSAMRGTNDDTWRVFNQAESNRRIKQPKKLDWYGGIRNYKGEIKQGRSNRNVQKRRRGGCGLLTVGEGRQEAGGVAAHHVAAGVVKGRHCRQ